MPTSATDMVGIANLRVTQVHAGNTAQLIVPTSVVFNAAANYWQLTVAVDSFSTFYVHTGFSSPLALSLSNFAVSKQIASNILTWQTLTEQNNKSFTIQKSVDGIRFYNIGTLNSKAINGNSSQNLTYSFVDTNPVSGFNYYQLQQTDKDGNQSIASTVQYVVWNNLGTYVTMHPNPATTVVNINIVAAENGNTIIKLVDLLGKLIKEQTIHSFRGSNKVSLSIADIAAGVYTLQVIENGQILKNTKLVKER